MEMNPTTRTAADAASDANLDHLIQLEDKRGEFLMKMDGRIEACFDATVERFRWSTPCVHDYATLAQITQRIDSRSTAEGGTAWAERRFKSALGVSVGQATDMVDASETSLSQSTRPGIYPIQWEGALLGPYPRRGEGVVYLLHRERPWESSAVVYVGYSTNVRQRIKRHRKTKRGLFTGVSFIRCASPEIAYELEGDLIYQHKPELNKQGRSRRRHITHE